MRFEENAEKRRLAGRTERRGSQTGFSTAGAWLFGSLFVATGVATVLIGLKVIPVDPDSVHAPYWVLTAIGAVFALCGGLVWEMAWRQRKANLLKATALGLYPEESALADYAWDPAGIASSAGTTAFQAITRTAIMALFLAPFSYWALSEDGNHLVILVAALFNLIFLAVLWEAATRVGRALKFGRSRVIFRQFPCRLAQPIRLAWIPATGIGRASNGSFTLRCVHEWHEGSGTGRDRTVHLVHEEQWSGTWHLDHEHDFTGSPPIPLELSYTVPDTLPATSLQSETPIFWELEIRLDLPGLDFTESYLIPVY